MVESSLNPIKSTFCYKERHEILPSMKNGNSSSSMSISYVLHQFLWCSIWFSIEFHMVMSQNPGNLPKNSWSMNVYSPKYANHRVCWGVGSWCSNSNMHIRRPTPWGNYSREPSCSKHRKPVLLKLCKIMFGSMRRRNLRIIVVGQIYHKHSQAILQIEFPHRRFWLSTLKKLLNGFGLRPNRHVL